MSLPAIRAIDFGFAPLFFGCLNGRHRFATTGISQMIMTSTLKHMSKNTFFSCRKDCGQARALAQASSWPSVPPWPSAEAA
jgi:hypothetical protein